MSDFNRNKYIFSTVPTILDVSDKAVKYRENQISLLIKELFLYKVLLKDLVGRAPKYMDKNLILNISYYIVENPELLERVQKNRELPNGLLVKKLKISRTFVELWQDYILTYIIILSNPNYKHIQNYIKIEYKEENNSISTNIIEKNNIYKGIVLKKSKNSSIILTSTGDFIKIKESNINVGCEVESTEKKGIKHYKIQIAVAVLLILLSAFGVYNEYNKPTRTVVLNTTSQIKYDVNRFNKVIYVFAPSEKGKDVINSVKPLDQSIDQAIKSSIEYAFNNKMIPNDGILITVNGEALKYGVFKETGKYIVNKEIKVLINNAGNEHKLYESIVNQKEESNEEK